VRGAARLGIYQSNVLDAEAPEPRSHFPSIISQHIFQVRVSLGI
jgi:hypothetical protein